MTGIINTIHISKIKAKNILTILFLVFTSIHLLGQQVWPVQITGSMIPPRSLDLGVYSLERSQDLSFNVTLNDPVQASLPVQLRLTIESNNQVIYKTDPNFIGPNITLSQFQQQLLDGIALQPYLTPSALVGATNDGMGSLEIPEGFNKICLEVYGIDRNVPLSRKFCVQGSFQLNQPPQLSLPACEAQMEYPETQNLIFNWTPMHIGSSNSPMPVEYQFELVRLPDGVTNANDAFETAIQVYQTTTMTPSLLYSQMEPLLEVNKLYAWRVKAYSMIHPTSKLFQNEGYSQICTFMYYDEDGPTSGNSNDKPSPTGCEVFDTDYGPITDNTLEAVNIVEEDVVKMGYFDMVITQAIATGQGFSGTGLVNFPMLRSMINVNFSGLRVNNDLRVVEVQEAFAEVDQQFKLDASEILPVTIADNIDQNYISQLDNFFSNGMGINRLVSGLDPAEPQTTNLPLGLDQEDKATVAVIGINFTPRNAYLNLVSWQENNGSFLRLAGTTIPATPFGVKSGAHLVALDGLANNDTGTEITPIFGLSYASSDDTKMDCSCLGYKDMTLEPSVTISSDIMNQLGTDEIIVLKPKSTTDNPEEYVGELKDIADFKLTNLPDFEFKPKNAYLDLSTSEKLSQTYPGTDYQEYTENTWRGLIIDDLEIIIPEEYDFSGNNNKIKLDNGQLFIDEQDLAFGHFSKTNLLSLEDGKMGDWAYSVDTLAVKLSAGQNQGAEMSGSLHVPVVADLFSYSGALQNNGGQIVLNVSVPNQPLSMNMWNASLIPDDQNSGIDAKLIDAGSGREFFPKANFSGELSLNMSDSEMDDAIRRNKGQKKSELNTVLGITDLDFELEGVQIIDFTLDPFVLPQDRYTLENTNLDNATLRIGGIEYSIGQIDLVFEEKTETEAEELGLRIVVLEGNNKAEFIFWGKQSSQGFEFDGIEINTIDIKCECTSMIVPPSKERWGSILDEIIESEYAVLFDKNAYSGSLNNFGISKEQEGRESTLRATLKAQLNANHVGGFPMLDDETISIPFLSKSLKVQLEGGKYKGESAIDDPSTMTFASLSSVPSDQLPFDVTNMLDELGVKVSNLPANSMLLLTAFETNGNQTDWSGAKMELTLLYEVYKNSEYESYLRFTKSNIPVGPSSVDFSSLYMHLQEDGVNGDNDEVIYNVGDGSASLSTGSFAYMNCTEGFKYFNVQGIYKAAFSTEAGNTTNKIIHRLSSPVNGQGAAAAQFGFTVNSETSLGHFIAPLKSSYDNTKDWSFSASGVEQLIFRPKENFKAYIDFDDEASHEDQPSETISGDKFMGLVFKDISVEVDGMKRANDEALIFDITDVVFDAERGLLASLSLTNPVTREENALLGGWQYDISSFSFSINKTPADTVKVAGNILPPILDGAPPVSNAITFDEGWVGFEGTIDFDAAGDVYQPDATLQVASVEDKLFHSSFIPGFGLELNGDSKIGMSYNSGNGEFEASLDFSGNAGIYLSQPLIEAKYAGDKPSGLDGISFVYELFEFQNLKINDGDAASNCTGGGTYKGIKTIEFGTWGILAENKGLSNAASTVAKGLQGFPLTIGTPRFNCSGTNEYRMTLPVNLNLMSDEVDSGDEGADSNTSGLNAAGELGFILGLSESGFSLEDFELGCLLVEGAFGPVEMQGGLNILRSDGANTKWGDGFKAFLEATVAGINVQAVAQFGSTNHDQTTSVGTNPNGNKYRYFFIDLEATSDKGIPLGAPPVAKLYGLGGGFRYNMNTEIGSEPVVKEPNATSAAADHGDNDNCTIDADLIGAGVSLSGTNYFPDNGVYGGYVKVIAGAVSPQVFVGDLAVGVTIQENNNKLAFEQISISGNGYFQASSVKDRKTENVGEVYANIAYTVSNKTLSGEFGVKLTFPSEELALITIPATGEGYAEGQLDVNFGTGVWGFKFGSWGDPEGKIALEPKSKLKYNTALFSPPFLGDAGMLFKFYVQAGHDVDNIPPIEAVVPDWDNGGTTQKRMPDALFKSGNGMVMGAKMEMNFDKKFGPFRARLDAGLGFDLSMIKYEGVDCGNGGIGLNNWYMQGQAYAYAAAKVDMQYKLPFMSGTINIADLYAALVLQAKFPNPSYFKGQMQARYSVLGGLLKGRANVKVEFGEQCEALEDASPIAGIKMVADVFPNDDASDVSIFVKPKITTNLAIGSALVFPNYDDDGNVSNYEGYRAVVDYVKVKKSGTSNYISASIATETYGLTLKFNELLEANTEYELRYHIVWEEDKDDNGSFYPLMEDGNPVEELDTISFTTGAFPDAISTEMLQNQAPGFSQRYWHENYASPLLRFSVGDSQLAGMFPESTVIEGNEVRYEYVAAITEYNENTGDVGNQYTIPVVSYPGSKTFKKAVQGEISIGTVYKIPTVTMKDVTVKEVRYPGLSDLNLGKGRLCKLEIIRRPEQTAFATTLEEVTGENGETITNRKIDGAQETAIAEATKILYEYHFGVSKYDNLHDKLQAATVNHQKSTVKRADLNHPLQKNLTTYSMPGGAREAWTKDDYFSFKAEEGFDKFDLIRIRKNSKISYLDDYGPDTLITVKTYEGENIASKLSKFLLQTDGNDVFQGASMNSEQKKYLTAILNRYESVDREKDGTFWNYNFYTNTVDNNKWESLSVDEISGKKMKDLNTILSHRKDGSYNSDVFSSNVQYGLLYQDLRTRILLNQLRWIAHIGFWEDRNCNKLIEQAAEQAAPLMSSDILKWQKREVAKTTERARLAPYQTWHRDNTYIEANASKDYYTAAREDGYKYSYDGEIKMEFPKVSKWEEMDTEVNMAQYPKLIFTLQPDYTNGGNTGSSIASNTDNTTSGEKLALKTSEPGVRQLINMKFEDIPKYIYLFRPDGNSHPIAMWSKVNNVLILFNRNDKDDVRLIPAMEFPKIIDGKANFSKTWKLNEPGFNMFDLYGHTKQEDFRVVMMDDNGEYHSSQNNQYAAIYDFSPVQSDHMEAVLNGALETHFAKHSLPYNGIYQNIPGVIEPANYDWGGPGIAYKDNNEQNNGTVDSYWNNGYRPSEGVDIAKNGDSGTDNLLGWFDAGEWTKYSVNIKKEGRYNLILKYSSNSNNGDHIQLKLNGQNLTDKISLPRTGSYTPSSISIPIDISSDQVGIQKLSIHRLEEGSTIWKLQFIHQPPAPYAGTPIRVPSSRIEAENFDAGGEGVAYHDADSHNRGDSEYRGDEGVDISNKTEASNGKRIGWCVNEWLNYTVDVNESKKYDIFIGYGRKPGNAYAKIYSNGVLLEGNTTLPTTGSYSIIGEHKYGTFDLEKGVQTLKIEITGQMAFDYIDIRDVASTPYANITVPGLIPAKNYDNGGEGVAYHKAKPNDVSRSGYPKFHTNSWARYTFNVSEAKPMALFLKHYNYDHEFVGSVDIDGNLFSNVAMTRAEETYVGEVTLSPGTHVLTLKGTGASNFAIITNIEFKDINPTPYNNVRPSVPCRVEFEHFAEGGEGVGYYDTDPEDKFSSNAQSGARPGAGVDIYGGTIVASGPQEWLNFPINVPATGAYQLKIKYGTNKENCKMNVSSNGRNLMDIRLPETGSWSTNTDAIETITLDEGNQTLKLMMVSGNVNLDYFEITPLLNQGVALKLDGENDHVALPNAVTSAIGGGNAVTIEYWFKGTNSQSAVRFQDGNGHIVTAWGSNKWSISSDGATDNSLVLDLTVDSTNIYDGEWHHLAMTWQRNTTDGFRLYLDGIKIASRNSNNSALPNISSNGRIGSFNNYERTSGSLDEVRIWNRALPEEEIQDNMNCLRPSNSPGLVAYYNFDDKSLKNLVDNGNATASGFATSGVENWVGSFGKITETCTPVTIAPEIALIDGYLPFELADSGINKSFALGDVPLDGENIIQTIKIENKGNAVMTISNFNKYSTGGGYTISELNSTNIPPGAKDSITITYNRKVGTHNGSISFNTNDPNQASVNLAFSAKSVVDGANRSLVMEAEDYFNGASVDIKDKPFTVEFWAKSDSISGGYIVCQGTRSAYKGLHIGFRNASTFTMDFYASKIDVPISNMTDWNHYACVYTGTEQIVYQNGIEKARRISTKYQGTGSLLVGKGMGGSWAKFAGKFDELRVWNRALSSDEINAWQSCKPASNANGLLAYYNFDEKSLVNKKDNSLGTANGFVLTDAGLFTGSFGDLTENCATVEATLEMAYDGAAISTSGSAIDLGELDLQVSDQLSKSFIIKNTGLSPLEISSIEFTASTSHFTLIQPEITTLQSDESTSFDVVYAPNGGGVHTANVKVNTNASNYNGGYTFDVNGEVKVENQSLTLEGPDYFNGSSVDIKNKPFTIEFWAKSDAVSAGYIVCQGIRSSYKGLHIGFRNTTTFSMDFYSSRINAPISNMTEWNHYACVYTGSEQILYQNGVEKARRNSANYQGVGRLLIGKGLRSSWAKFAGTLDELRVWNRALSSYEINAWQYCKPASDANGLLAYYDFDDNSLVNKKDNSLGTPGGFALTDADLFKDSFDKLSENCPAVTASLEVTHNGIVVSNSGSGLNFGKLNLQENDQVSKSLVVKNTGLAPLEISSIEFTSSTSYFTLTQPDISELQPGESTSFNVVYTPNIEGAHTANVKVNTNASNYNGGYTFDVNGKTNQAHLSLTLEGPEYFNGSSVDIKNKPFTIEFWAKSDAASAGYIVCQGEGVNYKGLHIGFRNASTFSMDFYASGINMPVSNMTEWNHYSCVYTGTEQILYLNGIEKERRTSDKYQGTGNLLIGKGLFDSWAKFAGSLDELRVWDRALSSDEINAWKSCKPASNANGLLAYYNFNEKSLVNNKDNSLGTPGGFALTDDGVFSGSFGGLSENCGIITPTPFNLSQGKTTTASSQAYGGVVSRVVDGNTNGSWSSGSVMHTAWETGAWVTIDLGSSKNITEIEVFNRTDCCMDHAEKYFVMISDNPFPSSRNVNESLQIADWQTPQRNDNNKNSWKIPVTSGTTGRYVRIQFANDYETAMHLAEIKVMGW